MTIVIHRANRVGDNVVAIKAFYALKCLFPQSRLVVATNGIGENLYAHLPFIDILLNLDSNPNALSTIDCIDYFIITHRTSVNIAFAKATNARKIIAQAHLHCLFFPRFILDFNFFTNLRTESENLLRLVRLVDKRAFDNGIKNIDFSNARLKIAAQNSNFVRGFFDSNTTHFSDKNRPIIGINFFGSGGICYFSLPTWREIIQTIAQEFRACNFIILTAPPHKLKSFDIPNIAIFANNADLLNLVAITERFSALISIDTGNVHIADNLRIPTLGISTPKMAKKWRGGTYGGKFAQFIMPISGEHNDLLYKEALLDYARAQIPMLIESSSQ